MKTILLLTLGALALTVLPACQQYQDVAVTTTTTETRNVRVPVEKVKVRSTTTPVVTKTVRTTPVVTTVRSY